jgi:uncharacterized membrane protein
LKECVHINNIYKGYNCRVNPPKVCFEKEKEKQNAIDKIKKRKTIYNKNLSNSAT